MRSDGIFPKQFALVTLPVRHMRSTKTSSALARRRSGARRLVEGGSARHRRPGWCWRARGPPSARGASACVRRRRAAADRAGAGARPPTGRCRPRTASTRRSDRDPQSRTSTARRGRARGYGAAGASRRAGACGSGSTRRSSCGRRSRRTSLPTPQPSRPAPALPPGAQLPARRARASPSRIEAPRARARRPRGLVRKRVARGGSGAPSPPPPTPSRSCGPSPRRSCRRPKLRAPVGRTRRDEEAAGAARRPGHAARRHNRGAPPRRGFGGALPVGRIAQIRGEGRELRGIGPGTPPPAPGTGRVVRAADRRRRRRRARLRRRRRRRRRRRASGATVTQRDSAHVPVTAVAWGAVPARAGPAPTSGCDLAARRRASR